MPLSAPPPRASADGALRACKTCSPTGGACGESVLRRVKPVGLPTAGAPAPPHLLLTACGLGSLHVESRSPMIKTWSLHSKLALGLRSSVAAEKRASSQAPSIISDQPVGYRTGFASGACSSNRAPPTPSSSNKTVHPLIRIMRQMRRYGQLGNTFGQSLRGCGRRPTSSSVASATKRPASPGGMETLRPPNASGNSY